MKTLEQLLRKYTPAVMDGESAPRNLIHIEKIGEQCIQVRIITDGKTEEGLEYIVQGNTLTPIKKEK